jgi:ABC-type polysaccharide/polyol phosphate export permease
MWILSGVFFSARRFPAVVQPFISALPLTAIVDALRAHMLQGRRSRRWLRSLACWAAGWSSASRWR